MKTVEVNIAILRSGGTMTELQKFVNATKGNDNTRNMAFTHGNNNVTRYSHRKVSWFTACERTFGV